MPTPLPSDTKVIIVGGGIAGCSVAYHLTQSGWKDVVLLEQNQLAGGTTWHAAGLVGRLRTTNSMTKINKYSAELYASLEKETGRPVGWKQVGSLIVGRSRERMSQLRRTAAMAEWFGVEVQLVSPKIALEKWPLAWFELMLPRQLEIIYEINRRLVDEVRGRFPGDEGRVERVSLIDHEAGRKLRRLPRI